MDILCILFSVLAPLVEIILFLIGPIFGPEFVEGAREVFSACAG